MKKDFTLTVVAYNNFNLLNRMINICNRRRVRIKKMVVFEHANPQTGEASFILYDTEDMLIKVRRQMEKLIEVAETRLHEGTDAFYNEQKNCMATAI